MTFLRGGKKYITVKFDGKSIGSRIKMKNLSDSDFIYLKKNLASESSVVNFMQDVAAHVGKNPSSIFESEVLQAKLASYLSKNDIYIIKCMINKAYFSQVVDHDNYFTVEASAQNESGSFRESLDKHVIVTINKLSGVIEIAWLERKKDEGLGSYWLRVNFFSDTEGFCMSQIVQVWIAKMVKLYDR